MFSNFNVSLFVVKFCLQLADFTPKLAKLEAQLTSGDSVPVFVENSTVELNEEVFYGFHGRLHAVSGVLVHLSVVAV